MTVSSISFRIPSSSLSVHSRTKGLNHSSDEIRDPHRYQLVLFTTSKVRLL